MIHMPPEWIEEVQRILRLHVPERRVKLFGSRASGLRLKPHSDIDLCVMGDAPVDEKTIRQIKDAFADSNLPVRVDIVTWAEVSPVFRANILEHCEDIA